MNLKNSLKSNFKMIFNKKTIFVLYFIFFIIINILDFFNVINGDLDFLKKLLSWFLIGYIFYKASFSKIFIGTRLKLYDLIYILAFCLMTIPKLLASYVYYNKENLDKGNFILFQTPLKIIDSINIETFLLITLTIGIILTIIISIALLLNHKPKDPSFISSFNIREGYFKYIIEQFLLIFISLFFGIVIFNFFIEWFALGVDSVILVLGLIYYLIIFIQNHLLKNSIKFLNKVSNSGNQFFKKIIELFSNKKTMFIGMAFILTLHTLVDTGVFLIPYTIGTENTFYFSSLDGTGTVHTPIFNFIPGEFTNSQFYTDLNSILQNTLISITDQIFLIFGIFITHISTLFLYFSLMILPFYIFYKNTNNEKIKFGRIFTVMFITTLLFYTISNILIYDNETTEGENYLKFIPIGFKSIDIDEGDIYGVNGIDIYTNNITSHLNKEYSIIDISTIILIFLTIIIFLLFRYSKFKLFYEKSIFLIILLFFTYYIFLFSYSSINLDLHEFEQFKYQDKVNIGNEYLIVDEKYNTTQHKFLIRNEINVENQFNFFYGVFSIMGEDSNIHKDYVVLNINNKVNKSLFLFENNNQNIILDKEKYNLYPHTKDEIVRIFAYSKENKSKIYYYLGENVINLESNKREILDKVNLKGNITSFITFKYENKSMFIMDFIEGNMNTESKNEAYTLETNVKYTLSRTLQIIRIVFISIFYIFGLVAFVIYYVRNNLIDKKEEEMNKPKFRIP